MYCGDLETAARAARRAFATSRSIPHDEATRRARKEFVDLLSSRHAEFLTEKMREIERIIREALDVIVELFKADTGLSRRWGGALVFPISRSILSPGTAPLPDRRPREPPDHLIVLILLST